MSRRSVSKQGPASPRSETSEEEYVFDYAGLEDYSDESGPVPREAYIALRKGIWLNFKFTHSSRVIGRLYLLTKQYKLNDI